jgi:hypothetical protein
MTLSSAERVRRRRDKLRRQGMRPIQIWVPDTRSPGFAEEAARQSRLVAAATTEEELDWLDWAFDDLVRDD